MPTSLQSIRSTGRRQAGWCLFAGLILAAGPAWGLDFSQSSQQWVNSPPLNFKNFAGKTVVLYFFHEQDPECHANWPKMKELAKKYETQPVYFLAINSTGQRNVIESYVQQVKIDWPVYLDSNRDFSRKCEDSGWITELSMDNGIQIAILNPDATIIAGSWEQPEESFQKSLGYSKWNIDATLIPPPLRETWRLVELQQYPAAAGSIRKQLKSPKEDVKAGAEALMAYIQPLLDEKVTQAATYQEAGDKWAAYRTCQELTEQFKGYELPDDLSKRMKELQTDPAVKAQVAAMKTFETARKMALNPAQKKKGITALKKLIKDKPDTDAAGKAEELVTELEN